MTLTQLRWGGDELSLLVSLDPAGPVRLLAAGEAADLPDPTRQADQCARLNRRALPLAEVQITAVGAWDPGQAARGRCPLPRPSLHRARGARGRWRGPADAARPHGRRGDGAARDRRVPAARRRARAAHGGARREHGRRPGDPGVRLLLRPLHGTGGDLGLSAARAHRRRTRHGAGAGHARPRPSQRPARPAERRSVGLGARGPWPRTRRTVTSCRTPSRTGRWACPAGATAGSPWR